MDDTEILRSINALVDEEHHLLTKAERGGLSEEQHERLRAAQTQLDQCWDLLRQRRARREFGQNPDDAKVRDANTVEHYKA
ncbi:MAG TPA: DUF2630 family protein [Ktedonobacterales bacterium]|nr:DUF2630 family protein [Ktedonobacterales bacterium]HEX5569909.1 DUF2630 family protein [Ktedonobacterales bacterium]